MNRIRHIFALLKAKKKIGGTLQHRLSFFFLALSVLLLLGFTLLLFVFGITGREEKAIHNYINNELSGLSTAISDDFGHLSVDGINLAEDISKHCDDFFSRNNIIASELKSHPQLLEPLLGEQLHLILNTVNSRACGGAFILLDATIKSDSEDADFARSGIFIKKTQPISTQSIGTKLHYLRGPAQVARNNGIELLGQWRMEYDIQGQEFFTDVMETARSHPDLPLSRLYYWSGRVTLKGNSEAGFLLCVPLRSSDGYVFGLCGIEVSNIMFKTLYSPEQDVYESPFSVASPSDEKALKTSQGIVASNYYLMSNRLYADLVYSKNKYGFEIFTDGNTSFGGKSTSLRLYPSGSPYENQTWSVAVLMKEDLLEAAVKGNSSSFIWTVVFLLLVSIVASILTSQRYLRPVNEALNSIRNRSYEGSASAQYKEINDLFEFLAEKDREHEKALKRLDKEKAHVKTHYERAQLWITHLAEKRMPEVDSDSFELFVACLNTLTPKEKEIFDLYLAGNGAKEIQKLLSINQNTLKYHNKNIYSKLGVSSRKQLLEYAALLKYKN